MRSMMWALVAGSFLAHPSWHQSWAAESRPLGSSLPRLGETIPASVRIIGVDGESRPQPFGLVIVDGRFVALVEAGSRRVVEVTSDEPRGQRIEPGRGAMKSD
jgi:hypothetical protein